MGVFKQCDSGACNPFNGKPWGAPATPVPSKIGAPGAAADGLSSVLIVDLPVPELDHRSPRILPNIHIGPDRSTELAVVSVPIAFFRGAKSCREVQDGTSGYREFRAFSVVITSSQNFLPVTKAAKVQKSTKQSQRIRVFSGRECVLSKYRRVQRGTKSYKVLMVFSVVMAFSKVYSLHEKSCTEGPQSTKRYK